MARLATEAMPYLPIVKAKAPKAPIGAAFITMCTNLKNAWATSSRKSTTGLAGSPTRVSDRPNRIEISSTCRISPSAKAPTTVSG
jgi:hypothetical protein